jgi:predicted ATP-grasp superfamily ATP-dependent carboligase
MFRVLVTDASYKHAIALVRHARSEIPDLYVIGHTNKTPLVAKWHACFDAVVCGVPLERALETQNYDMIIPVGGRSVLTVAARCPELSVLPPLDQLKICYDKPRTIELAQRLAVPAPQTWSLERVEELDGLTVPFPCVVKPSKEATQLKIVAYCRTPEELRAAVTGQLEELDGEAGVVLQEFIPGDGCGFFALMENANPLRIFMHKRIREYPPSGGRSTAARAFYSPRLKELGLRLLTALKWHGVAMVEFKHDAVADKFVLLEINAKFWGSLELALSAGVNFGADLIRVFRGEKLQYKEDYDRSHEFYWPLDDDIVTLLRTRSLRGFADYWKPNAHTNLLQSFRVDAYKSLRMAKMVFLG